MFQIASTIGVARKNNQEYFFPKWEYQDFFTKELPFREEKPDLHLTEGMSDYRETNIPDGKIFNLNGYLQSHFYFNHYKEEVLSFFELKKEYLDYISSKYNPNNKTSIHIRRTDYLVLEQYHTVLGMEYYSKAIEEMGEHKNFLVFSDDIEWCREKFEKYNCEFVEEREHIKELTQTESQNLKETDSRNHKKEDVMELFLMSLCNNNIIANSSFSWWAAYLNKNKNKKIIAPNNWFTPKRVEQVYKDTGNYIKHRIPEGWILI